MHTWYHRSGTRRATLCACAALVAAALAATGCGPGARIGPVRGFASCAEDLALSVGERMHAIHTLHDPDATLAYSGSMKGIISGPLKSVIRGVSVRAMLYLSGRRKFRADISHALVAKLARLVLNEDGILLVYWPDKKAFRTDIRTLLSELPDIGLGPDYFIIRKLFFPDLEAVSGERPVLTFGKDTYTVEFWTQGRLWPVRAVTVDDWSHAVTRAVFYTEDGRTGADIRWSRFEYLGGRGRAASGPSDVARHRGGEDDSGLDCVVAKEVVVKLPSAKRTFRFKLKNPRYNVKIRERRAYDLRPPPGVEVEAPPREKPGADEAEQGEGPEAPPGTVN